MREIDVAVIGAGQAGLSISHCLTRASVGHVVLEKGRIRESWRSARWDSFCLVTPNWSIRLPDWRHGEDQPAAFMPRDEFVRRLEAYARQSAAPVEHGAQVVRVTRSEGDGFRLDRQGAEPIAAKRVVVATATHRHPKVPGFAGSLGDSIFQCHASAYRSPAHLPPGGVVVVGSAQSGCQIADELNQAGRPVWLSTGSTGRLPRRYRGRDIIEWQQCMGYLDRNARELDDPAHRFRPDPHLSGAEGGKTLDLRDLSVRGVRLTGRLKAAVGGMLHFENDLARNLADADAFARRVLREVDAYIDTSGVVAPEADEQNSDLGFAGERFVPPAPERLDLGAGEISSLVWATGFRHDFTWVQLPVFDVFGYPVQAGGQTSVPGLHFLGLNYVERRASGILYGVGEDAEQISRLIVSPLAG